MDIAALSVALNSISTGSDVGVLMLKKQLEQVEMQGNEMVKALEQSVNPHLGTQFDVYV